ncbi:VOC family protein [Kytococcus schroeteri]|uniref:VOC family protein n=1 Tax=Kytococcus schroeteri TaxID=138300 RepID=A0A2I1PDS7_9MICO|nr:VOC family protein [Kytococcus schroeteri]PKZ42779.1 VOC family protein [Kytococcus schroeteri]
MHAQPFLTFQPSRGQRAAEAMALYCDVFGEAEVLSEQLWGADGPGGAEAEGTVMTAEFRIGDLRVRCSDSPVQHAWDFSPAQSLWVEFSDAAEHQRVFDALADGGQVFMPVGDYGFGQFGWAADRFGVNWQLVVAGK